MLSTGLDDTVVVIAAPAVGAVSLLEIDEAFVITVPFASGLAHATTIWTLPDAPSPRLPMVQVHHAPPASRGRRRHETRVAGMASGDQHARWRSRSRCVVVRVYVYSIPP